MSPTDGVISNIPSVGGVSPETTKPPLNVLVAVVEVAWKYGAEICLHASNPPERVEVPTPPMWRFRVVVGVSTDWLNRLVVTTQS